jgi:arsenate reductase
MTRKVMAEAGFDLSGHRAKDVTEYMGRKHFGYLITVCAQAERNCPKTFPGIGQRLYWDLADPAAFEGPEEEQLAVFRETRNEIEKRIQEWVASIVEDQRPGG